MQRDVLIVGFGLAGWALTEVLKQQWRSFVVYDSEKKSSSSVAVGIYNPIILKRFTSISYAQELMDFSIPFYAKIANGHYQHPMSIWRVFAKAAEQNKWMDALDKPTLSSYMSCKLHNRDILI
jgi:hypothetical protein